MPKFKCVKQTTFRGRQVSPGAGVTVSDEIAATLEGNPCWEDQTPAAPKKPKQPDLTDEELEAKKLEAEKLETKRLELLQVATDLGCSPRSNTGIKKLEAMIEKAKQIKPDEGGAPSNPNPGSIV